MKNQNEKERIIRFFNQFTLSMILLMIALMVSFFFMLSRQYNDYQAHMDQALMREFKAKTGQLEKTLAYIGRTVESMRFEAELYINRLTTGQIYQHPSEFFKIEDHPSGFYFHLDQGNPADSTIGIGNLTGEGSIREWGPKKLEEISMAVSLNTLFRINSVSIKESNRVFYLSSNGFINFYPWVPSEKFRYSLDLHKKGFFKAVLPWNNPSKVNVWSEVYPDVLGDGLMTSCSAPVFKSDQFLGSVGLTFSLNVVSSILADSQTGDGYFIVLNNQGQIVGKTGGEASNLKTPQSLREVLPDDLWKLADNLENVNSFDIAYQGDYRVIKTVLEETSWHVLFYKPKSGFIDYLLNGVGVGASLAFLGFVVIVLFILWGTYQNYTLPTKQFINYIISRSVNENTKLRSRIPKDWEPWFETIQEIFATKDRLNQQVQKQKEELEIKVELRTEELSEKTVLLSGLIQSIPDIVFFKNLDGINLGGNQAYAKFVGLPIESIVGRSDTELFSENKADFFRLSDSKVVEQESTLRMEEWTSIEGEKVLLDTMKSPLYDEMGKVIGIVGISRDVTLLKKTEEELKKAKEEAEAASRVTSEFLTNMSHELRTPLNAVIGCSELLSKMIPGKKEKSYISTIQTAGKSLLTLINDVLDLSKAEAGKLDIALNPTCVRTIFKEIGQMFTFKIDEKNLEFKSALPNEFPDSLFLDETRLRQVLTNLVGNAIKFTHKGYVKLEARIEDQDDKNGLCTLMIGVEDTGTGIPKEDQERIFEAFSQRKGQLVEDYGGTGLGLAISKRLVEMMGGQISLKSEVEEGSTFMLTLRNIKTRFQISASPIKQHHSFEDTRFSGGLVLVVDDIESNVQFLEELLSILNLETISASNGLEALSKAKAHQPDLIILDIMMPIMDGYEAIVELRSVKETKNIPVVALTAYLGEKDKSTLQNFGFNGWLFKPLNIDLLIQQLILYFERVPIESSHDDDERSAETNIRDRLVDQEELLNDLEKQLTDHWPNLSGFGKMGAIQSFADEIVILGKRHHSPELVDYGFKLSLLSENFNVDKITKELNRFPDMVQKFKLAE